MGEKSWKNNIRIDKRSREDLQKEIAELAQFYVPEWRFDTENPDMGSVIGIIFARQMEENVALLNQAMEVYHEEFVNMLGLTPMPAKPAKGIVRFQLLRDTVSGALVKSGSRLLAGDIPFRTIQDLQVADAKLEDIWMISGRHGKILEYKAQEEIPIFDYRGDGVQKHAIWFAHKTLLDPLEETLEIRFWGDAEQKQLLEKLGDEESFRFCYLSKAGYQSYETIAVKEDRILLRKKEEAALMQVGGEDTHVLCLEARHPVRERVGLNRIQIAHAPMRKKPELLCYNNVTEEGERFLPFGEMLAVYDECFIGNNVIFSKKGAVVTVEFVLSYEEREVGFPQKKEENNMRIMKRKPQKAREGQVWEAACEKVIFEYYNGVGWTEIPGTQRFRNVLNTSVQGNVRIEFVCPTDWEETVVGGFFGRVLRIQLIQSDGCYRMPCVHRIPVLEQIQLSYSYEQHWQEAEQVFGICGTQYVDYTQELKRRHSIPAFAPLPYKEDAMLMGFDKKIEGGPVSLFFKLEESTAVKPVRIRFEYSTQKGFLPLRVVDKTRYMTQSGVVYTVLPEDFKRMEIEGKSRYWIRMVKMEEEESGYSQSEGCAAVIQNIFLNAVEAENVLEREEEEFYLDYVTPNMSFSLPYANILDADVYVNEKKRLSAFEIRKMLEEMPENVRAVYDRNETMTEFYVLWQEVQDFEDSREQARHYRIDRQKSRLLFGDGIRAGLPSAQQEPSFLIKARCSNGNEANVESGKVDAAAGRLLYIGEVDNPLAMGGGSDMESQDSLRRRGETLISSKDRLISEQDFIRTILTAFDSIDKVRCIPESQNGRMAFVILMKRYRDGKGILERLRPQILELILKKSDILLTKDQIDIADPVYVEISLEVWVKINHAAQIYQTQNAMEEQLYRYLEPISGTAKGGRNIGELPRLSQIKLILDAVSKDVRIQYITASARYTDGEGVHETELEALKPSPYFVGINGKHQIHVSVERQALSIQGYGRKGEVLWE